MHRHRTPLTGWGLLRPTVATVVRPRTTDELAAVLRSAARGRGAVARGLGRSYGDAAQNADGTVVDCADLTPGFRVDAAAGTVTASAGTSLDTLLRHLLPRGFFLPVTPGTRQVTVGGAIAADVHGKNHHVDSSFGAHLRALTLVTPDGAVRRLGPDRDPDLFWATVGGMGLTGVITEATFTVLPVTTSRMRVDTDRIPDLEAALAAMTERDDDYRYSVCWLDLLARGRFLGRGVLTRAHHAHVADLPPAARRDPLRYRPRQGIRVPRGVPSRLLTPTTVRAFNTAYYAAAPRRRRDELQEVTAFFYPLDALRDWNRLYGSRGLVQYQFTVPFGQEETLRRIVEHLAKHQAPSFLAVLKRFGPGTPAPLSFPQPGWTLAVDLPADLPGLLPLLTRFDEWVLAAGGRLYLAKDSRAAAATVHAMYPELPRWRRVRDRVDPERVLVSDLARRLEL